MSPANARAASRAMFSPSVDVLAVGGLSILVCLGLIAFGPVPFQDHFPALLSYALTACITWPHFLSSYRLLYATKESALSHPVASLYFPAAVAAYGIFAVVRSPFTSVHVDFLTLVAGVYLARHYTGQTWGMMASFGHVSGVTIAAREKRIFQLSLDAIMMWHISWAMARVVGPVWPSLEPIARLVDARIDPVGVGAFAVGLAGFFAMTRRMRKLPPARLVVPWFALFGWYALLRHDPTTLVVVQVSHALQYLLFPLRIEQNQRENRPAHIPPRRAAIWIAGLAVTGLAVFAGIPTLFRDSFYGAGGASDISSAFTSVFVSFVNIHHYFVDGCLYKLRNPAVRREIFAHLPANTGAA